MGDNIGGEPGEQEGNGDVGGEGRNGAEGTVDIIPQTLLALKDSHLGSKELALGARVGPRVPGIL